MVNYDKLTDGFNKAVYRTLFRVKSISKAPDSTEEGWGWRTENIGKSGLILVFTFVEGEYNGKSVIYMEGDACLQTSPGELTIEGDTLTLAAKNSVYVFENTGLLPAELAGIGKMSV